MDQTLISMAQTTIHGLNIHESNDCTKRSNYYFMQLVNYLAVGLSLLYASLSPACDIRDQYKNMVVSRYNKKEEKDKITRFNLC